jgi:hypothetical protein
MFIGEEWGASADASTPLVLTVGKATISLQYAVRLHFQYKWLLLYLKSFKFYGDNNLINKKDFWVHVLSIFMFVAEITIQKFTVYFFSGCEILSLIQGYRYW